MDNRPNLPAFSLTCDSLTHEKFTEVIELPAYFLRVFAYKQGLDGRGNISLLIILADSQKVANDFAEDLGQRAKPVLVTPPSTNDH